MLNFKFSIPFLAFCENQIPYTHRELGNQGTEAIMFNAEDLFNENWEIAWENIKIAADHFLPKNVTFHFPVNNCDYAHDNDIFDKLVEAYKRACDLGLAGVVVHSNCIRKIHEWSTLSIENLRNKVFGALFQAKNSVKISGSTWLALENMPIMDNFGVEIDPLFLYPEDFKRTDESIGVVLDVCHFFYTVTAGNMVFERKLGISGYPNLRHASYKDIENFKNVKHWHFSAFRGIAEHGSKNYCKEGVLPKDGTIDKKIYMDAILYINSVSNNQFVVLELNEDDYSLRSNAKNFIHNILKEDL